MSSIRVLIADDEPAAVAVITMLMQQFAPDMAIVGVANNGLETVQQISQLKPDLVFLDVDMPAMNGIQVLDRLGVQEFQTIFTTGSADYALKALKLGATDYLLKPIDPADFILALERARKQLHPARGREPALTRIQLPTQNGIIYLDEADIVHIHGMGSYSGIHTTGDEKITVSKSIGQMEDKLSPGTFFRCHNSNIVNLDYVAKFLSKDGFLVEMKNGAQVEVSRRSKEELLHTLSARTR